MNATFTVLTKELLDSVRDRRSLLSLLLFPLVGPLAIALVLTQAVEHQAPAAPTELPVVGAGHAPALVEFLEEQGIAIAEPPADAVAAVRDRRVEVVLVIPSDFGRRFRAGKTATVELVLDESNNQAQGSLARVRRLLRAYGSSVGSLRLLAHGVSADLAEPLKIHEVDLSTPKTRAAVFLNLVPMFVLLAAFIGGMYTATDATAGERERGSLEPLLVTPIARRALVRGKWLAAVVFSALSVVFTLACTLVALSFVPVERFGISLSLTAGEIAGVLVATLPLSLFVAAAQMLVASFARSFKEAQTYLSLMVFVPMLPGLFLSLQPVKTALWMVTVPVLGQQVMLMDMIRGEPIELGGYLLAALSATLAGLICVHATAALFRRERIIFGA